MNLGPNAQTYIVNERTTPPAQRSQSTSHGISNSASNDSNLSEQDQEHPEINVSVNPANNNNIHDNADNESQSDDGTQQVSTYSKYFILTGTLSAYTSLIMPIRAHM